MTGRGWKQSTHFWRRGRAKRSLCYVLKCSERDVAALGMSRFARLRIHRFSYCRLPEFVVSEICFRDDVFANHVMRRFRKEERRFPRTDAVGVGVGVGTVAVGVGAWVLLHCSWR